MLYESRWQREGIKKISATKRQETKKRDREREKEGDCRSEVEKEYMRRRTTRTYGGKLSLISSCRDDERSRGKVQ